MELRVWSIDTSPSAMLTPQLADNPVLIFPPVLCKKQVTGEETGVAFLSYNLNVESSSALPFHIQPREHACCVRPMKKAHMNTEKWD